MPTANVIVSREVQQVRQAAGITWLLVSGKTPRITGIGCGNAAELAPGILAAIEGICHDQTHMTPEARLTELGLQLPPPPAAAGSYVPSVRTGNLLFCAGTICLVNGQMTHTGQVGREQTVETAYRAAEICALNALANIKAAAGSLDQVARIVFVSGFVNAVDGFADSPAVINGASDLFVRVFGEAGKHARAAVAVNGLPRGSTTEIQVVVELKAGAISAA